MKEVELKKVKQGEWFTLKPIKEPKEKQVWVREEYDRANKKYYAHNFGDASKYRELKGERKVYIEFYF